MNPLIANIQNTIHKYRRFLDDLNLMETHFELLQFSDTAHCSPGLDSCWIYVSNREDLMTALSISRGGIWQKETREDAIHYTATVDNIPYEIRATNDALPNTCKLVEEEYTVEAQPARQAKRFVVKCNQPISGEPAQTSVHSSEETTTDEL